jgi:hypothetical protein
MAEDQDIARISGAHELGLVHVRSMILLNGGAFTVLLAYMASASTDAIIRFNADSVQKSIFLFLAGIVSIMLALLLSYMYTALNFKSGTRNWLDAKLIPANIILGVISLGCFSFGVISLARSVQTI